MNVTVLPISRSQMPLDSLGMLWSDGYSHTDDILHLTPSLSRTLEARQLWAVHSTFDLSACLGLICLAYIFCHSFHPAVHPPPHFPRLPPECHQLFHHLPPLWSVSLPQDLSSDWDGMFQGCTIPGANEILNQFMEPPPNAPPPMLSLSDPFISAPPPPPLYPAVVHLFSNTDSYLFRCLLEWILTLLLLPPHSLSVLLLPLCQAWICPPSPPPFHPPSPNATCTNRCVAPIDGFVTAATCSRKLDGEHGRELEHVIKERVVDRDRGWIRALNKWLKESGAQDHSSSMEATAIPVCC